MTTEILAGEQRGLTGNQLKLIAAGLMVLDHIHQMFHAYGAPIWFTWLGRLVAPIFLFMSADGFFHTRNKKKYMLRLYIGYLAMGILSQLISTLMPNPSEPLMNNIFGTFFVATVYMLAIDLFRQGFRERKARPALLGLALALAPALLSAGQMALFASNAIVSWPKWLFFLAFYTVPSVMTVEGGPTLVLMGVLFYVFRQRRPLQIASLALMSAWTLWSTVSEQLTAAALAGVSAPGLLSLLLDSSPQWLMVFASVLLLLYNGQRGKGSKYFFYIFYPAHIYALYIAAWLLP
ncbi:MAG: conjugal transfer protein TraX [Peptococcaceae bacterium]|jgi:hypothetical protein|nr:conjugal transfer protein TraX [Peptococcaceae bacterium]